MTQNAYTVSQVNAYIKNMFTQDFMLNRIYVKGEVSNCKYHSSGHIYFSLKDESGTIACVMFARQRGGLSFRMQEGQQVIVFGRINVYESTGQYQLYASNIRLDGEGLLYEKYMQLKADLEEMGMFSPVYKKDIPPFAMRIGIVTAPTGAAIKDIIRICKRRNPYVELILYPALVQGEGAKESIAKGIAALDGIGLDLLIVGRGGGSIEDLWAFNEEMVARAIFECRTPIISAVGHETDTTIADFVADKRAATPSEAAEMATFEYVAFRNDLESRKQTLQRILEQQISLYRYREQHLLSKLIAVHPQTRLNEKKMRLIDLEDKLKGQMDLSLKQARYRLSLSVERMNGVSPLNKLQQGYSYTESEEHKTISSVFDVKKGQRITTYVKDGVIESKILTAKEISYGREEKY